LCFGLTAVVSGETFETPGLDDEEARNVASR
jgi:hypothetical protein